MALLRSILSWLLLLGVVSSCSGTALDEYVRHYEPVLVVHHDTQWTAEKGMTSKTHFSAHGREFDIHLETNTDIFLPEFKVYSVGKDGERTSTTSYQTKNTVRGFVEGEKDSVVYGHMLDGAFRGVIRSQAETYHVEPITNHFPADTHGHNRIIYRESDVNYDLLNTSCLSDYSSRLKYIQKSARPSSGHSFYSKDVSLLRKRRAPAVDQELNTCTVAIVADYEFFSNVGNGQESTTIDEMTLHIMKADEIYRRTVFTGRDSTLEGFGVAIQSAEIYRDPVIDNPLSGSFSVEELLEAFSETNFDNVCLGHLFTYRDFQGTIGLAYLGDPNGQFAGGICQKRTTTSIGERSLNTGFTSLLNFGRRLPLAVSLITTAHELGHNHGSPHDPAGQCSPGAPDGNYIMFASATDGNRQEFSPCSRESIGMTIEARGGCFVQRPSAQECGNGIIEEGEECDCGYTDEDDLEKCRENDFCCNLDCTLKTGAECSAVASACCNGDTCEFAPAGVVCLKGDSDVIGGGCQQDSTCPGGSAECPAAPQEEDGTPCNDGKNTCRDGACTGSPCSIYGGTDCFCTSEQQLCHVCCIFDGVCTSTFDREGLVGVYVQPGYPCGNFSGYCTGDNICKRVDNDNPLDQLKDILLDFTSIAQWLRDNWYWVLGGFAALIILIILLQLTYRRKKLPTEGTDDPRQQGATGRERRWWQRNKRGQDNTTYGFYQTAEDTPHETTSLVRT